MLSLHEAQELHELIGVAMIDADAGLVTSNQLERARELAAVLVSDTENAPPVLRTAEVDDRIIAEQQEEIKKLSEAAQEAIAIWRGGPDQHDYEEFESAMGDLERALR